MKYLMFLLGIFYLGVAPLESKEVDSLLKILDRTILEKNQFNTHKRHRIDSLRKSLIEINSLDKRYKVYQRLFREYRNYNMDTALIISNDKLLIAQSAMDEALVRTSKMDIAEIMGIMGMYKEALDIMDGLNRQEITDDQIGHYYHVYHSTYILIAQNSLSLNEKKIYESLVCQYKDSILSVNHPESLGYRLVNNGKLVESGDYQKALSLMIDCYKENEFSENIIGTIAYGLSEIYEKLGDEQKQIEYLVISSISDLRRAKKGYIALRKLAILLYQKEDIQRAYTYIKCSMEDATFCKARFRTLEISENLPIIIEAYEIKMKKEKENIISYLVITLILTIALVISILFIIKQLKKLNDAKKSKNRMYEEVKANNNEIRKMVTELTDLNTKLSESNFVKEAYICSAFNMCSIYINKMESYRININRKLRQGDTGKATAITGSPSLELEALKEFLRNFDAVFLSIYPNFIEEFNKLLKFDEQIIPKGEDILTPELRVFALIRLGISDSSKIASFFHYSPQTVYNYKLKIRNKLIITKEEFSDIIMKIGR